MEAPHNVNKSQPQASHEMNVLNNTQAPSGGTTSARKASCHHDVESQDPKVSRLRGGGAGKDCFLCLVSCFLCFECCEVCCGCVADCICCPCEMCC